MNNRHRTIEEFVDRRNEGKYLFTAGPASLLSENITGLRPCFGRGDDDYTAVEENVLNALRKMSGHDRIARMQGSASLALEIMALNFLYGKVLVVSSGYYSDRLQWLAESAARRQGAVRAIQSVPWDRLDAVSGAFDWVVSCYTETSCGLKLPIERLTRSAKRLGARLMLDATASIGLEPGHEKADVIGYSSCKGLFGLTGACFIAFNELPAVEVDSFYLKLSSHLDKMMTGPYHTICSLADVLPRHEDFRFAVSENKTIFMKKMADFLTHPPENQPLLCTHVACSIAPEDPKAILYHPRSNAGGSVVCHLGEVHLHRNAEGELLQALRVEDV